MNVWLYGLTLNLSLTVNTTWSSSTEKRVYILMCLGNYIFSLLWDVCVCVYVSDCLSVDFCLHATTLLMKMNFLLEWELSCTHCTQWVVLLHLISWALSCNCHQRCLWGHVGYNAFLASQIHTVFSHIHLFSLSCTYTVLSHTYILTTHIHTLSSHMYTHWLIQC